MHIQGRHSSLQSWARTVGAGFCVLLVLVPVAGRADELAFERASIEVGTGLHVPFNAGERDVYDSGASAFVGYTTRLSQDGRSRVMLDLAWLHASGAEVDPDPTFELDDARYDLLELGVGLRQNAVSDPEIGTAFWLGAGILNVFSWWRDPLGQRDFQHVVGFYLELSPQVPVSEHWRLWLRTRLQVVADVDYENLFSPLDYDASTIDAGVTYVLY